MRDPKLDMRRKNKLSDPPRLVSLPVRLKLMLGGFSNQFGWLFFGFGLVFVWVFGGSDFFYNTAFFSGELAVTDGIVTQVEETNLTINESSVYAYHYKYSVDEKTYTGNTRAFGGRYQVNNTADIEYVVSDHGRSRIKNLSTGIGWGSVLTVIFPIIGLIFMVSGIQKGTKGVRLLCEGKQAMGRLVSREATGTKINDQTVYKFSFEFEADDGRTYTAIGKTHLPGVFTGENTDQDGNQLKGGSVQEPLLYNPRTPSDAVLLDDLPGGPRIERNGAVRINLGGVIPSMVIPCITVVGHTWWALHVLEMI